MKVMDNIIELFKKPPEKAYQVSEIIPAGTPTEEYSETLDYIRVTGRPESYKSYREFLMTLNRFIWVLGTEQQNDLIRRAQMTHNMITTLTAATFHDDEAIEQHMPKMPEWF